MIKSVVLIGRSEILYGVSTYLLKKGISISAIVTTKHAPEYTASKEDFLNLAKELEIPCIVSNKNQEIADFLGDRMFEVAISANHTGIINAQVISKFEHGILNIHGGDLPRYRGNACQAWAILNGENRIGLCVHKMVGDELDAGDIISRSFMEISSETKVANAWNWMVSSSPRLVFEALSNLSRDPSYILERQSLNPADSLRCYPRRPEDGKINWSSDAGHIVRLVNASGWPYEGAFCFCNDTKIYIDDCCEVMNFAQPYLAVNGQLLHICEEFVDVACGSGVLRIKEIRVKGATVSPSFVLKSLRLRLT